MLLLIGIAFYDSARHRIGQRKWLLKALLWGIPLPWIAIECGWFVAEYGRQPWTISGSVAHFHVRFDAQGGAISGSLDRYLRLLHGTADRRDVS